ncbi:MAG: hypothetical protein R3E79_00070 [Caldilineaceae bacterium]
MTRDAVNRQIYCAASRYKLTFPYSTELHMGAETEGESPLLQQAQSAEQVDFLRSLPVFALGNNALQEMASHLTIAQCGAKKLSSVKERMRASTWCGGVAEMLVKIERRKAVRLL